MCTRQRIAASFILIAAYSHSLAAQHTVQDPNEPATSRPDTEQSSSAQIPTQTASDSASASDTKQTVATSAESGQPEADSTEASGAAQPGTVDVAVTTDASDTAGPDNPKAEASEAVDAATAAATTQAIDSRSIEVEKADSAPELKPANEMSLADVIALVQQQQEQLATQRKQLKAQSKQIASLSEELDALRAPPPGLATEKEDPDPGAPQSEQILANTDSDVEGGDEPAKTTAEIKQKTGENVAVAQADDPTRALLDDFPGAWRLPGTQAALSIGGFVKTSAVINQDPLEIKDRFIVGSIPVEDTNTNSIKAESSLSAAQSRLNFDLREPTEVGTMRAFIEGDFAEDNDTFRLRHAFGQWDRMLAGKTWSAFVDTLATPEEVDFEGLNGRINVRQSQLRFSPPIGEDLSLVVSLEDPNPQIQGGSGVTRVPDVVLAGRFEPSDRLHMKLAVLGRQIRAQTIGERSVLKKKNAWGLTMSGRFTTPFFDDRDGILFQLSGGTAIGRYVNDLDSVGSYDGIFDEEDNLELFDVVAGYVSYQHWWGEVTRSNITFGVVDLQNPSFVEGDAYKRTIRSSANLLWTPTPRVDIGWELLWGERTNEDGATGDALQTQFMARYRFSQ
jgi:hypothetical protein